MPSRLSCSETWKLLGAAMLLIRGHLVNANKE